MNHEKHPSTLNALLIQCGSEEKKTTAEIIATQDLASIQNKKAEVVKSLNTASRIKELNQAIAKSTKSKNPFGDQHQCSKCSLSTTSFQGTLETDRNIVCILKSLPC